mmetsp:Transcript_109207/g.337209  ORF Transcript_109207/g.337209 Transcript_109207/m.337209 type:complete len:217 (+) Transcript_109207:738-1388(+)
MPQALQMWVCLLLPVLHFGHRQPPSGVGDLLASLASASPWDTFLRTQRPLSFFTIVWSTSPRWSTKRPSSSPRPPCTPRTPQPTSPGRHFRLALLPSVRASSGLEYSNVSRPHVFFLSKSSVFLLHSLFSSKTRSSDGFPSGFRSSVRCFGSFRFLGSRAKGVSNFRCLLRDSSSCSLRALSGSTTGVKRLAMASPLGRLRQAPWPGPARCARLGL